MDKVEEIMKMIKSLSPEERKKLLYAIAKTYPQVTNTTNEWYPGDDEFEKLR